MDTALPIGRILHRVEPPLLPSSSSSLIATRSDYRSIGIQGRCRSRSLSFEAVVREDWGATSPSANFTMISKEFNRDAVVYPLDIRPLTTFEYLRYSKNLLDP